jgi:hypothetical protein
MRFEDLLARMFPRGRGQGSTPEGPLKRLLQCGARGEYHTKGILYGLLRTSLFGGRSSPTGPDFVATRHRGAHACIWLYIRFTGCTGMTGRIVWTPSPPQGTGSTIQLLVGRRGPRPLGDMDTSGRL